MFVIAVEGVSGAGKSTFVAAFNAALRKQGYDALHLGGMQEEHTENPIQRFVRDEFLQSDRFIRAPFWVETSLLIATAQYNNKLVEERQRAVLIRENFVHGLRAYQCARAIEDAIQVNDELDARLAAVAGGFGLRWPDVVVWIDVDADIAISRLPHRDHDRALPFGEAEGSLIQRVVEQYRRMFRHQRNVVRLENSGSLLDLTKKASQVAADLTTKLGLAAKSQGRVYIAGPLFTPGDRLYLERIDDELVAGGIQTFLPHRDGGLATTEHLGKSRAFFDSDFEAICWADAIIAVLHGSDVDAGTAWEIGAAFAMGKPVVGVYEDTRGHSHNLMVANSVKVVHSIDAAIGSLTTLLSAARP